MKTGYAPATTLKTRTKELRTKDGRHSPNMTPTSTLFFWTTPKKILLILYNIYICHIQLFLYIKKTQQFITTALYNTLLCAAAAKSVSLLYHIMTDFPGTKKGIVNLNEQKKRSCSMGSK